MSMYFDRKPETNRLNIERYREVKSRTTEVRKFELWTEMRVQELLDV